MNPLTPLVLHSGLPNLETLSRFGKCRFIKLASGLGEPTGQGLVLEKKRHDPNNELLVRFRIRSWVAPGGGLVDEGRVRPAFGPRHLVLHILRWGQARSA